MYLSGALYRDAGYDEGSKIDQKIFEKGRNWYIATLFYLFKQEYESTPQ